MNFDAFELIEKGLQEELAKQGFSEAVPLEDPAGRAVMFTTEDVAYSLLYERAHQRFQLRSTTLKEGGEPDQAVVQEYWEKFLQQVGNDLNTSMAVTLLYDALKTKTDDATKLAILGDFDQVLSLSLLEKAAQVRKEQAAQKTTSAGDYTITGEGDPAVDALVLERYQAKKAKNFAKADQIRDELKAQGIEITDVPGGASWKRV